MRLFEAGRLLNFHHVYLVVPGALKARTPSRAIGPSIATKFEREILRHYITWPLQFKLLGKFEHSQTVSQWI